MNRIIKHITLIFMLLLALGTHAQISPGGVNNGLNMWFDADWNLYQNTEATQLATDNQRIYHWGDRLNDTLKAVAAEDSMRPTFVASLPELNGKGALRFYRNEDAGNKYNNLYTNGFPTTKNMTIYTVFLPVSAGAGDDVPFVGGYSESHWYGGSGIVDAERAGIVNDFGIAFTNTSIAAGAGNPETVQDVTLKIPSSLNTPQFAMSIRNGDSGSLGLWKNGGNHQSGTCGTNMLEKARFTFGANNTLTSNIYNYFDGYIANVIVFTRVINDIEKVIIDNYLAAKYGIQNIDKDVYTMDMTLNGDYDEDVAGIGQGFDGTQQTKSKGEGIITISNPSDLENDEYLFWGTKNIETTENEGTDVPKGFSERLKKTWAISEVGEVGKVRLEVDLSTNASFNESEVHLIFDANKNGVFVDEPQSSWIKSSSNPETGVFVFDQVDFSDKARFTFGKFQPTQVFTKEKSLVLTPNGDYKNDVYEITGKGKVQVINKLGELMKELQCPCSWDGTNADGQLVQTGVYLIKKEDNSYVHITVIR